MTEEMKKAGKAHVYGTPLIALVLAVLGYLDNRDATKDAVSKANKAKVEAHEAQGEAQDFGEERRKRVYNEVQATLAAQSARIDDLEGWVVELEEFIEDQTEEDSPRNQREREARDLRLAEIRAAKRVRERQPEQPASSMVLPDYATLQKGGK